VDGLEYVGFSNDDEFLEKARFLLSDDSQRSRIAAAANSRCWTSGYSTTDRAVQMVAELVKAVDQRASKAARKDGERESLCDALQYRCDSRFITNHPLCRKEPLQGVKRWLAWQIAARLAPVRSPSILSSLPGCLHAPV